MEQRTTKKQREAALLREDRRNALIGKYFDLFCASFEYEGISRAKYRRIMSILWGKGTCLFVKAKGADMVIDALGDEASDASMMGLCSYNPITWNLDGEPLEVTCQLPDVLAPGLFAADTNATYAEQKLLPIGEVLKNGKDCVVGYALQSHRPISEYVIQMINFILDAEVAIRNNQVAMGLQTTVATQKDAKFRIDDLADQIMNGSPIKRLDVKTVDSISFPASGISDFTDGQYKLKVNYENELKTYLGIRNIGNVEKKERVNVEESASNNQETDIGGDGIAEMIECICDDCAAVLGFNFSIRRKQPKFNEQPSPEGEDQQEEKEDAAN